MTSCVSIFILPDLLESVWTTWYLLFAWTKMFLVHLFVYWYISILTRYPLNVILYFLIASGSFHHLLLFSWLLFYFQYFLSYNFPRSIRQCSQSHNYLVSNHCVMPWSLHPWDQFFVEPLENNKKRNIPSTSLLYDNTSHFDWKWLLVHGYITLRAFTVPRR